MSETPKEREPLRLTPELIEKHTSFKLIIVFPDFADSGRISPDLHEERERFSAEVGEDNVLPSFYIDGRGTLQLGLFVKQPESKQNGDIVTDKEVLPEEVPTDLFIGQAALSTEAEETSPRRRRKRRGMGDPF